MTHFNPLLQNGQDAASCCELFFAANYCSLQSGYLGQTLGSWYFDANSSECFLFPLGLVKNGFLEFDSWELGAGKGNVGGGPDFCPTFEDKCPYTTSQQWPGASPFNTGLGATTLISSDPASRGERAVTSFGSAGGFNPYHALPGYQATAVKGYLEDQQAAGSLPPTRFFNASGRGYPDISFLGDNIQLFFPNNFDPSYGNLQKNVLTSSAGTSAAAPQFAGLVSLLNEVRLAAGYPPMGFLNPWLYDPVNADMFIDISVGDNNIPRNFGPGPATSVGFAAARGWDAVTGLGTPNFMKMVGRALAPFAKPCPIRCSFIKAGCPKKCLMTSCPKFCPVSGCSNPALQAVGCGLDCCEA